MIASPHPARLRHIIPLMLIGVIPACGDGDGGDGTSSASATQSELDSLRPPTRSQ